MKNIVVLEKNSLTVNLKTINKFNKIKINIT